MKFNWTDKYAPLVLRLGMAIVFLYFGISQVINPVAWTVWIPEWVSFMNPETLIMMNGIFEIIFGTLLALGIFRRIAALLLGLHLLGIAFSMGFTQIAVRDFGLGIATLVIAMIKEDKYSLNYLFNKRDGNISEKI